MERISSKAAAAPRDELFDNVKAILILLVVVGHFCGGVTGRQVRWFGNIYNYIYWFHMPVFLMISGRFSKKRMEQRRYQDVLHKILLPYLMLTVCMTFLRVSLGLPLAYDSILSPYFGLWYLLAIGLYQLLTVPKLAGQKWYLPLVCLLILFVGFLDEELYGKFTKIIYFYVFFLAGYYSNAWKMDWLKTKAAKLCGYGYFILLVPVTLLGGKVISKDLLVMNAVFANMTDFSPAISLCAFFFRMLVGFGAFFALLAICPRRKLAITHLGKYSLYIYGTHIFIVYAMREILEKNHWLWLLQIGVNPWLYLAAAVGLCFLLASRPMRYWESYVLEPWQKLMGQV